jgi:ATPase subunit of ABC transporter with duplicated ATPase domains
MTKNESILKFNKVSFGYSDNKPLLSEVDFTVRRNTKITIMGQNGAGKTTIFGLISGELSPEEGAVSVGKGLSIAVSRQVIPREDLGLTVREFFEKALNGSSKEKVYDIDPRIDDVLAVVNFEAPHGRLVKSFSGGQQARLLLASALIQNPDLLLLDEPTNNLDKEGIDHLKKFLIRYDKTCIVISHDADFLNSFTDGVLYLDVFTRKVEQYAGNYFDVREQIALRQERENRKNALLAKEIREKKEKANYFSNKGGEMRMLAKRMRKKAGELEEEKVETRKEDRTIRPFLIPSQKDVKGVIAQITSFNVIKGYDIRVRKANIELRRNQHLLLKGPNGIGKTTLLESIAQNRAEGVEIAPGVVIGYYRQDFSTLNFEDTVYKSLSRAAERKTEENMRSVAAGFLITGDMMGNKIGDLSEGQKGLVAFARLVLQEPGLLILDEPTNHINFRHIPVIAEALNKYDGAMILVSHVPDFVDKIRIDTVLDLER